MSRIDPFERSVLKMLLEKYPPRPLEYQFLHALSQIPPSLTGVRFFLFTLALIHVDMLINPTDVLSTWSTSRREASRIPCRAGRGGSTGRDGFKLTQDEHNARAGG
jgi:hypothetical protein